MLKYIYRTYLFRLSSGYHQKQKLHSFNCHLSTQARLLLTQVTQPQNIRIIKNSKRPVLLANGKENKNNIIYSIPKDTILYQHDAGSRFSLFYIAGFVHFIVWTSFAGWTFFSLRPKMQNLSTPPNMKSPAIKQFYKIMNDPVGQYITPGLCCLIGTAILLSSHRHASRFVKSITKGSEDTILIETQNWNLFGKKPHEISCTEFRTNQKIVTGLGKTKVMVQMPKDLPWIKRIGFRARMQHVDLIHKSNRIFKVDREGRFFDVNVFDKIFYKDHKNLS